MALINQRDNAPPTIYVKHPVSGIQVIEIPELAQYLAVGYRQLPDPSWFYHQIQEAEIFDRSEAEELAKKGWVDSPAKLTPVVAVPEPIQKSIDWDDPKVVEIDEAACALLAGEGLNQAALMRSLNLDPKKTKQRNEIKPYFQAVLAKYVARIYKQQNDYFWIAEVTEAAEEAEEVVTEPKPEVTEEEFDSAVEVTGEGK